MKKNRKKKISSTQDPAFEQVRRFYEFMNSNKISALEFSKDDVYIKLVRKAPAGHAKTNLVPVSAAGNEMEKGSAPAPSSPSQNVASKPNLPSGKTIKAPMSGIFYRSPSPSSPPYAREGDHVRKGQVLCIIEAMKVFNEIKCEQDCQILRVLAENGKPVEPNSDLFLIK